MEIETLAQLREAATKNAMTPKQVLEAARGILLARVGYDIKLTLRAGLDDAQIESVAHWPRPLPPDIRELVQFARGFAFGPDDEVDQSLADHNPDLLAVAEARASSDAELQAFARTLPDSFVLCDLRARRVGSGFALGDEGQKTEVRRFGSTMLFAIETSPRDKPSFWQRLLGRWKKSKKRKLVVELK